MWFQSGADNGMWIPRLSNSARTACSPGVMESILRPGPSHHDQSPAGSLVMQIHLMQVYFFLFTR